MLIRLFQRFQNRKKSEDTFDKYPHLKKIKPNECYIFHSDYFEVDNGFATILSFFHNDAASDNFGIFWGINRIPTGLPDGVVTVNFEQIQRMSESWLMEHQTRSEHIAEKNEDEQTKGSNTSRYKAMRSRVDLDVIAQELNNGASYLNVQYRLLVKAPSLELLETAIDKIERLYIDRFGTLSAAPYIGEQRKELSSLFSKNERKKGKGYYFTSTEYAGSYSLVTHGLEDSAGEYVGRMIGDVNTSAVLFDVDRYRHHIVVASEQINESRNMAFVSDMWGSKISQACLLNNGRVVHLIFDNANLDRLGPLLKELTYKINMNQGDVNPFEMFGETKNELSIFPSQMEKLKLMAEQMYEPTGDRNIIRSALEEIATKFYIENRMWFDNAAANRDKIRIVGIPHNQIPKLEKFVTYLETYYKQLINSSTKDEELLHAVNVLKGIFKNMLTNNGDLFNTITNPKINNAMTGQRVIYDFSELMLRGKQIAMAQLVNIISFAVGNLSRNDTVIIHGTDYIDESVMPYLNSQFLHLYAKGGRVAFCYNDIDTMLSQQTFNNFDKADYTIMGNMTIRVAEKYQKIMGNIAPDLSSLITDKTSSVCYIRRDFDNVVFMQDLQLDP